MRRRILLLASRARSSLEVANAGPLTTTSITLILQYLTDDTSPIKISLGEKDCIPGVRRTSAVSTYAVAERRRVNKVISGGQFRRTGTFTVPKPWLLQSVSLPILYRLQMYFRPNGGK